MARVVKAPEVRRNEILDCAQALFSERGYEETTVNDVIAAAGISKGAFYHHFPSKQAMLEALAERIARESMALLEGILADASLGAIARMNALLAGARRLQVEAAPETARLFDIISRPGNVVLYHRIERALSAVAAPALARIIAQGMEEGIFRVPDAEAAAEMILQLRNGMYSVLGRTIGAAGRGDLALAAGRLDAWLEFYGIAVDRILGLPDRTLQFVEPGFAEAVLTARVG